MKRDPLNDPSHGQPIRSGKKTISAKAWRITAVNYRFLAALIQPLFHWITAGCSSSLDDRTLFPSRCVCVCLLNKLTGRGTRPTWPFLFFVVEAKVSRREQRVRCVANIPIHLRGIIKRKRRRRNGRETRTWNWNENYTVDLIKRGITRGSTRNFARGLKVL